MFLVEGIVPRMFLEFVMMNYMIRLEGSEMVKKECYVLKEGKWMFV